MTKAITKDIRDEINEYLESQERKLTWLSKKADISYSHLYFILVRKERDLTDKAKDKINEALGTNF